MKTVMNTLLVVVMAAVPAVAQPTAKAKVKAKAGAGDYYPLKVGSKWTYEMDAGQPQKTIITSVIAAEESSDGKRLARLEVYINGQKAPNTEHLMSNQDGIFRVKISNQELDPPLCLLKLPLKAGQTWQAKSTVQNQPLDVTYRQGAEEDVQVPAGKYRAIPSIIETTQQAQQGPLKIVNTYWFVDEVGVVKQKMDFNGKVILMELTKYEAAPQ